METESEVEEDALACFRKRLRVIADAQKLETQ